MNIYALRERIVQRSEDFVKKSGSDDHPYWYFDEDLFRSVFDQSVEELQAQGKW